MKCWFGNKLKQGDFQRTTTPKVELTTSVAMCDSPACKKNHDHPPQRHPLNLWNDQENSHHFVCRDSKVNVIDGGKRIGAPVVGELSQKVHLCVRTALRTKFTDWNQGWQCWQWNDDRSDHDVNVEPAADDKRQNGKSRPRQDWYEGGRRQRD